MSNESDRRDDERRTGDRRQKNVPEALANGWDGVERRMVDRRTAQERRREERRMRDERHADNTIESWWPMDAKAEQDHNRRQDERRARERRATERRKAQLSADQVDGWDGSNRREVEDRRDIERRELERRIRAAKIADSGTTPGV